MVDGLEQKVPYMMTSYLPNMTLLMTHRLLLLTLYEMFRRMIQKRYNNVIYSFQMSYLSVWANWQRI
ncbi:hypothetical protein AOA57_30860 [Pseudomonas sp. 2588-5]|nr:hypothetical protein AOA57_30860 [Pseudomonas sp. 2588-5]